MERKWYRLFSQPNIFSASVLPSSSNSNCSLFPSLCLSFLSVCPSPYLCLCCLLYQLSPHIPPAGVWVFSNEVHSPAWKGTCIAVSSRISLETSKRWQSGFVLGFYIPRFPGCGICHKTPQRPGISEGWQNSTWMNRRLLMWKFICFPILDKTSPK